MEGRIFLSLEEAVGQSSVDFDRNLCPKSNSKSRLKYVIFILSYDKIPFSSVDSRNLYFDVYC